MKGKHAKNLLYAGCVVLGAVSFTGCGSSAKEGVTEIEIVQYKPEAAVPPGNWSPHAAKALHVQSGSAHFVPFPQTASFSLSGITDNWKTGFLPPGAENALPVQNWPVPLPVFHPCGWALPWKTCTETYHHRTLHNHEWSLRFHFLFLFRWCNSGTACS